MPPPSPPLNSPVGSAQADRGKGAGANRWPVALSLWASLGRLRSLRDNEFAVLAMSAVIGIAAGFVVVAMEQIVQILHQVMFALPAGRHLSASGETLAWWRVMLVPAVGGLIGGPAAFLIRRKRAHDTVDPIEANALFGGKMSLIDSIVLTTLTMISSGFGASVGTEAGFTQLGSGVASELGQILRVRRGDLRTLVGCGAAAAIAAAFNAPLAGAFYAFELVIGGYSALVLAPVAMAALFGMLVAREIFGAESIFAIDAPVSIGPRDYLIFAALGVAAAAVAIATMTGVTWVERLFRRLKTPLWLRPLIGGAFVGLIATIFPQVLGSGHGAIQASLDHAFPGGILLGLVAAKGLASAISVGSGFRGGLFSSSLLLGSAFGACAVFLIESGFAAAGYAPPAFDQIAYMLVGMGSVAAAIIGAPLTMIFLVLELTGSFPAAVAVMEGVIIASLVTRVTFGYSFATWRFHQRGVQIRGAYDVGWIQDLTVEKLMRRDVHLAPLGLTVAEFRTRFPLAGPKRVFLVDGENRYRGLIMTADIHSPDVEESRLIDEFRTAEQNFLLPEQNVRVALNRFVNAEIETLAVLSDAVERRVLGFLTEGYALRRYNQEFERVRAEELGDRALFGPG